VAVKLSYTGVGAQSTLGGEDIFAEKLTKKNKFYMILA